MLLIFVRTIFLYMIVLIVMRFMGKREIGQMQPFELVISIMIAELATTPMSETGIPILYGIIPILGLFVMHTIISIINIKSNKIREVISGKPRILINKGKIDEQALVKENFTIGELKERLRVKGIYSLEDVNYAILETSGQISVINKLESEKYDEFSIINGQKEKIKLKFLKEIIILFIVFIFVILINIITQNVIEESVIEANKIIEEIEMYVEINVDVEDNENNKDIISKIDILKNNWNKRKQILLFLIEHTDLEKINNEIELLKKEMENKNLDETLKIIIEIKFSLNNISEKNKFKLNNIF